MYHDLHTFVDFEMQETGTVISVVNVGESVVLGCLGEGYPAISRAWTVPAADSRYQRLTNGSYYIVNVSRSDDYHVNGNNFFKCEASNGDQSAIVNYEVDVHCKYQYHYTI